MRYCLTLLLAGLFMLAGCGRMFKAPEVKLRAIVPRSADELVLTVVFRNPNRIAIDVADFEYRVTLDTLRCAEGVRAEPIRLPAGDSTRAEFPIRIDYANLIRTVPALLTDSVTLGLEGTFTLPRVLGRRRLPFHQSRRFALKAQLDELLRNLFR